MQQESEINKTSLPVEDTKNTPSKFRFLFIGIAIMLLYFLFLATGLHLPYKIAFYDSLYSVLSFSGLAYVLPYSSKFIEFKKSQLVNFLLTHFIAALVISAIWTGGHYLIFSTIDSSTEYAQFLRVSILWRSIVGILVYFIIQSFVYLFIYYDNYIAKTVAETQLKSLVTEAELKSLKFQINPHFIFNSLNSVAALTSIDPVKAREMTIMLADFLRSTLSNNLKQLNSLQDELRNMELYINIEKIRFGDKFSFSKTLDGKCDSVEVPNMILQPLVENAIKYSVYESIDPVEIRLHCKCEKDALCIELENDYDPSALPSNKKGAGVGIMNIKSRLRLLYKQDNLFRIEKTSKSFKAILYIPRQENPELSFA